MTKPKAKRKGIVVTVGRGTNTMNLVKAGGSFAYICTRWLVRAGMKPLKAGESRKIRVVVEDV